MNDEPLRAGCTRAMQLSRFVARALAAELGIGATDAQRVERLGELAAQPWSRQRLDAEFEALAAVGGGDDEAVLARALRRLRRRVMLALAARDMAGVAELAEVVGTVTALAELAVGRRCGCTRGCWRSGTACRWPPTARRRTCWWWRWARAAAAN